MHPNIFLTHLLLTKTKPERHDLHERRCSFTHPFADRRNESLQATHLLLRICAQLLKKHLPFSSVNPS
jgi:hypothetical protein